MNKHLRLRMLTLFSLLFFFSVSLFAQEKLVTIHLENVSLREIFSAIEKQTTYRFSYRNVVIDATKDITISQTKVPVSSVLNEALAGKNLEYNIVSSKSIVISDKPKKTASDQKEISGIIKDSNGEPVTGATIIEKGTSNGAISDMDGHFSLKVAENGILQISYVGYVEQTIPTNNQTIFNIILKEDSRLLDEVVVVGYGSMKKKDLTGAITHVDAQKLVNERPTTVQDILRGTAPGLIVEPSSSERRSRLSYPRETFSKRRNITANCLKRSAIQRRPFRNQSYGY